MCIFDNMGKINLIYSDFAAGFMYDVTIPDGTSVQPGTRLMKTWRIRNAGKARWSSSSTKVRFACIYDGGHCQLHDCIGWVIVPCLSLKAIEFFFPS